MTESHPGFFATVTLAIKRVHRDGKTVLMPGEGALVICTGISHRMTGVLGKLFRYLYTDKLLAPEAAAR